jgi:hypothetical protein
VGEPRVEEGKGPTHTLRTHTHTHNTHDQTDTHIAFVL